MSPSGPSTRRGQSYFTIASALSEVVFEGQCRVGPGGRTYDVSPDGQEFLMVKEGDGAEDTSASPSLVLVQNWGEELKRLVSID